MSTGEFLYTVDGERVTLAEIKRRVLEKAPKLKAKTIIDRVNAGCRTWAKLCADPVKAAFEARRRLTRSGR